MTFISYQEFKKRITNKIHQRTGWNLSTTTKISQDIVDKVKESGGGNWASYVDYGSYHTSPFRTLRQFLDVLQNSSFGISENDLRSLLRKFKTVDSIEALNSFTQTYAEVALATRKNLWQRSRTKISNARSALQAKLQATYAKLKSLEKISLSDLRAKLLQVSTIYKILYSFISIIGSFVSDIEIVAGGIPLGGMGINSPTSVQEIEVAHSNKIVKIRAVGSIFLAHQHGGKDSIIIRGKLTGDLRMYWLAALWILTLMSHGKIQAISEGQVINNEDYLMRSGVGSLIRLNRLPLSKTESIVTQKPTYEKHMTFPVITNHEIITNCYLEVFSFEEKLETDRDVITYDLVFRTYDEPEEFIADLQHSIYRQAKGLTKTQEILRYSLNFTYRMMKWAKEYYYLETNKWKTDNYYDVDAIDMATAFGISLAGLTAGGVV